MVVKKCVSITEEQDDLIDKYNLSPSEIFRKGLIIELYELDGRYANETQKRRFDFIENIRQEMITFLENKIKELKGGGDKEDGLSNKKTENNKPAKQDVSSTKTIRTKGRS